MQAQYEAEQSRFEDESRNSMRLLSSANKKLTDLQNESNRLQRENQEFVIAALDGGHPLRPVSVGHSELSSSSSSRGTLGGPKRNSNGRTNEEQRLRALSKRSRNSQTPMMLNYEKKQTRETLLKGTLFKDISTKIFDTFMDVRSSSTFFH